MYSMNRYLLYHKDEKLYFVAHIPGNKTCKVKHFTLINYTQLVLKTILMYVMDHLGNMPVYSTSDNVLIVWRYLSH